MSETCEFCGTGLSFSQDSNRRKTAEQAMTLPMESRARLADLLKENLDAQKLGHIDRLWQAEAKRSPDRVIGFG
jgi:hypothetical protein